MSSSSRVVVMGGGHAGVQAAEAVLAADPATDVTVVSDETRLPYHRPPLSKTLVADRIDVQPLRHRGFYSDARIELRRDDPVSAIDRARHQVVLRSGAVLDYGDLVTATGSRPRRLALPGADLRNVFHLRDVDDATRLHEALSGARQLTVLGGGFIGLEVAASVAATGVAVTLLEAAPRLLGRSVSAQAAAWLLDRYRHQGIDVRLGQRAVGFLGVDGRVRSVVTADGAAVPCDVVLVGVGSQPNTDVVAAAGLADGEGVPVDEHLRTADPSVWAVGDCAAFPVGGARRRIESVQNAVDQGRHVGAMIVAARRGDRLDPYEAVPWFWSHQGPVTIQIAGLADTATCAVLLRRHHDEKLSWLLLEQGRLVAVESVNAPADHLAARALIVADTVIDPEQAQDATVPLKSLVPEQGGRRDLVEQH